MNTLSSYKHYVIQQTDNSIQSIAQKLYGDVGKWRMLVNLNHLEYPYLVKTPQQKLNNPEHLLVYGDRMLLPNDEQTLQQASKNKVIESNTSHYQPAYYDNTLGMDLQLDISTDVPLSEQLGVLRADGHTFKRVVGIQNLKQSLILRILTRRGTLLLHPNYGSQLPAMLGKPMNARRLADAAYELERVITTDTRVASVKITKKLLTYDQIFLDALVKPIGEDTAFDIYLYKTQTGQVSIR